MKIVSATEMREIDRVTSERFGVPSLTLMENAGSAVANFVLTEYPVAEHIAVVCGKGNNGGDGFVAARKLHQAGKEVTVVLLAAPAELHGDAAEMFKQLPVTSLSVQTPEELKRAAPALEADLILDAILGTGFRPPVSGVYAAAIAAINATSAPVAAVDIPSGADADVMGDQTGAVARADAIVTFTAPRPAHVFGGLTSGPTVIAPIGSPEDAIVSSQRLAMTTTREIPPLIAPRPAASNKGNFGHVLVVGGSLGKAGAAAMAGMSALRAGAGLSTVATPKSVLATVAGFHPELMTEPLDETGAGTISHHASGVLESLSKGKTVLAVGPGISRNPETAEVVRTLVRKALLPLVLDADGLNAFEGHAAELNGKGRTLVITPHPGEMARLVGSTVAQVQHSREDIARSFAQEHQVIVVLKGHRTLIAAPDGGIWVNTTGNPGMATGGTGDVLTGIVASFIAQNPGRVLEAVVAAVYLHGLAGDIARDTMGEQSMVATDLIHVLPLAFQRARRVAQDDVVRF